MTGKAIHMPHGTAWSLPTRDDKVIHSTPEWFYPIDDELRAE